ncbi:Hypothetical predicted protein [Marmota monax]|uniref:Uncharacterized protein n=1 Tax=Marmota monax TaxID=9995 RepID=A0A5E4A4I8_MARMO|nr:Hypothetical predicted protein [Marmota monax]
MFYPEVSHGSHEKSLVTKAATAEQLKKCGPYNCNRESTDTEGKCHPECGIGRRRHPEGDMHRRGLHIGRESDEQKFQIQQRPRPLGFRLPHVHSVSGPPSHPTHTLSDDSSHSWVQLRPLPKLLFPSPGLLHCPRMRPHFQKPTLLPRGSPVHHPPPSSPGVRRRLLSGRPQFTCSLLLVLEPSQ